MKRYTSLIIVFLFCSLSLLSVAATNLHGTIYNDELEPEPNVLVEINTTPRQKVLSTDGRYSLEVPPGRYLLIASKGLFSIREEIEITTEGTFIFDLFLLPDLQDEDELLEDTQEEFLEEEGYALWRYTAAGAIIVILLVRFFLKRKKYGPLRQFRTRINDDRRKSVEQHKEELAKEPGYLDRALEIIKRHDGRITQKELRKEMLYLSEAKVSLIVTELEHKGRIEKVKKGRGNVLILK